MRRRVRQDGVGDHDGGDVEPTQNLEHLVTVGAPVEPVLVLHDGHIATVQRIRTGEHGRWRSVDELADDSVPSHHRSARIIDDPHDADLGLIGRQPGCQRCRERRQTACGRRERTEDSEMASAT